MSQHRTISVNSVGDKLRTPECGNLLHFGVFPNVEMRHRPSNRGINLETWAKIYIQAFWVLEKKSFRWLSSRRLPYSEWLQLGDSQPKVIWAYSPLCWFIFESDQTRNYSNRFWWMEWDSGNSYRSARLRSNCARSESSKVGCMKRVSKNCDWFIWFGVGCDWFCNDDSTMLLFAPKPTMPLLLPPATTPPAAADDAAAAAANNNGFDVIVISRPGLPADGKTIRLLTPTDWNVNLLGGCVDAVDGPPPNTLSTAFCREDDEDATGCGRRGNRSNCWRAACEIHSNESSFSHWTEMV